MSDLEIYAVKVNLLKVWNKLQDVPTYKLQLHHFHLHVCFTTSVIIQAIVLLLVILFLQQNNSFYSHLLFI